MWLNVLCVQDSLVYAADLKRLPADWLSDAFEKRLPLQERTRISRLHLEVDRKRSLLGLQLLEEGMIASGCEWRWEWFKRDESGRPAASDAACDFNISHSGDIVVCAIGPRRLGIDVEKITPIDMSDFRHVMPIFAEKNILASLDPENEFFRWWTRVESIIKAHGHGFAIDMNSIGFNAEIATIGEQSWRCHDLNIEPGYACCLALTCNG